MCIDRIRVKKAFDEYVSNYNSSNGKIKLKIYHTIKVSKISEKIAIKIGLDKKGVDIAFLIGMLHDIGRFEQVKRYGTFKDSLSVNHAELGAEILFSKGKIRDFIDDNKYDEIIEKSILNHNLYKLPIDIDEKVSVFSKIIRDADKADIFRVNVCDSPIDVYGYTKEEMVNSEISKEVVKSFMTKETVPHSLVKSPVDILVSHIALIFGIYYNESIEIIREEGYFDKLIKFKSNNDITNEIFKDIIEISHSYLSGNR